MYIQILKIQSPKNQNESRLVTNFLEIQILKIDSSKETIIKYLNPMIYSVHFNNYRKSLMDKLSIDESKI